MTSPMQMNCAHQGEGWCLQCVQKMYDKTVDHFYVNGYTTAIETAAQLVENGDDRTSLDNLAGRIRHLDPTIKEDTASAEIALDAKRYRYLCNQNSDSFSMICDEADVIGMDASIDHAMQREEIDMPFSGSIERKT